MINRIAIAIVALLTGPFFINCAIATGDPFYAINNHTAFYLNREGTAEPVPTSAVQYTVDKFTHRPIAAADTVDPGKVRLGGESPSFGPIRR